MCSSSVVLFHVFMPLSHNAITTPKESNRCTELETKGEIVKEKAYFIVISDCVSIWIKNILVVVLMLLLLLEIVRINKRSILFWIADIISAFYHSLQDQKFRIITVKPVNIVCVSKNKEFWLLNNYGLFCLKW